MKTYRIVLAGMALVALFLTACGGGAVNGKVLLSALSEYGIESHLGETEIIDDIEITEGTDNDTSKSIKAILKTHDDTISYEKPITITCEKDGKEWKVTSAQISSSSSWKTTPIAGVTEDVMKASLVGKNLTIDGEVWQISKDNVTSLSISSQDTKLKDLTDNVTAKVTIGDVVEEAGGELKIKYVFDNEWKIDTIDGTDSFEASFISGKELNATEEMLIKEIKEKGIYLGQERAGLNSTHQDIEVSENDISDFEMTDTVYTQKGTKQEYDCKFKLTKPRAVLDVTAKVFFSYEDSWKVKNVVSEVIADSFDFAGVWSGEFTGVAHNDGRTTITVDAIDDDGTVHATYSYQPTEVTQYHAPGSYALTGKIDMTTLETDFSAGEWINEPAQRNANLTKRAVRVIYYIDKDLLYGIGHDNATLNLTKE